MRISDTTVLITGCSPDSEIAFQADMTIRLAKYQEEMHDVKDFAVW